MLRLLSRFASARPPVWFLLLTALVFANLLRNWSAPLLDRHEFRQTQTALTAYWMREDGWSLAYPLPVFGPPWSAPMEFPLYQALVAAVAELGGTSVESAGRAVAIGAFFAAMPALAGLLAAAGFPARTRWIALASVLLTPVYLFYSRTVLIESTALCLALWFLLTYVRGLAPGRWRWAWVAGAAVAGALAAMVKITTLLPICAPAALWAAVPLWRARRDGAGAVARTVIAALLPALVAAAAGWWWVAYADAVKAANPLAIRLQSAALSSWNFGTLAQRLDPAAWRTFALQLGYTSCRFLPGALALLGTVFVPRRYQFGALAGVAAFLVGPLCFFNLYLVHDYYFYANAVFLAVALGLLIAGLWENPRVPRWAALGATLLVGGLQAHGFVRGLGFYLDHRPPAPAVIAAAVRAVVPEDGVVVLLNKGWNPELPFYIERRAVMSPDGFNNDLAALAEVVKRLPDGALRAVVWRGHAAIPVELYAFLFDELGFGREAVATDGENTLFLRAGDAESARARLADLALPGLSFAASPLVAWPAAAEFKQFVAPLPGENPVCQPAPVSGRSLYGLSIARNGDRPCIVAHAPSRITLAPPPDATAVELSFGLADECIKPESRSDGVVVLVYTLSSGGRRHLLHRRALDPVANAADRGVQTVRVELPREADGPLVLDVSTGVTGNLSYDWFYWYRVAVR